MATFFMFGKYTMESVEKISSARTRQAKELVEKLGGHVKGVYALLGEHDLVLIVDLPQMADAMKASLTLSRITGISFTTSPAVSVEELDQMGGQM